MPEGPEVRREADRIAKRLIDKPLLGVELNLPHLEPFAGDLVGERVIRIDTRGKALLTHFSNGLSMYSHNQLYGKWVVQKRGAALNSRRTLRVGLHVDGHSALLYSASDIRIMPTPELAEHPFLRKLGPDVLDEELHWRDVAARLMEPEFARRRLAALYLDQHFLAGVGNYLRSEILFAAKLAGERQLQSLSARERGALARATLEISRRAYDTAGITNKPSLVRTLKRLGATRRDYRFAVFARDGLPCYRCGAEIVRREAGSRRMYECPGCQPPKAG